MDEQEFVRGFDHLTPSVPSSPPSHTHTHRGHNRIRRHGEKARRHNKPRDWTMPAWIQPCMLCGSGYDCVSNWFGRDIVTFGTK